MRQKKNRKKKKNRKIRILTGVVLGVGLAGALFFNVFKIRNIQVAGNTRYRKTRCFLRRFIRRLI